MAEQEVEKSELKSNVDPSLEGKRPQGNKKYIVLPRLEFFRLIESLILQPCTSQHKMYTGFSLMRVVGKMMGAESFKEEEENWNKIKQYLSERPH